MDVKRSHFLSAIVTTREQPGLTGKRRQRGKLNSRAHAMASQGSVVSSTGTRIQFHTIYQPV